MLDASFRFSQHSLSDFVECPRRFYLHYVAKQAWPTVETNPLGLHPLDYQHYLWRGRVLHRRIERHWLSVPPPTNGLDGAELDLWWERFQHAAFDDLPAQRVPELALVAPIGAHLLYARFDLLAFDPHAPTPGAVIVDWKTLRAQPNLRTQWFAQRLQTRVYLYVLATAGAAFNVGRPFTPEQCRMRYWLANSPDRPWVDVPYSAADYARDQEQLLKLVEGASCGEAEEDYARGDGRRCAYCTYRTLCHRKPVPAVVEEECFDVDSAAEIDY